MKRPLKFRRPQKPQLNRKRLSTSKCPTQRKLNDQKLASRKSQRGKASILAISQKNAAKVGEDAEIQMSLNVLSNMPLNDSVDTLGPPTKKARLSMPNSKCRTSLSSKSEREGDRTIHFADDDDKIKSKRIMESKLEIFTNNLFESLNEGEETIHPWLLQQLKSENYASMTKIQSIAVPRVLSGNDCMLQCQTGSGKTLAFVVPAIQYLLSLEPPNPSPKRKEESLQSEVKFHFENSPTTTTVVSKPLDRPNGTRVLLIAPTRELVNQTVHCFVRLTIPFPRIIVGAITGGEKRTSEKSRLRKGVTVLGTTVGRFCDHIDTTASFRLSNLGMVILDEADRLLDMGFEKKLKWIASQLVKIRKEESELKRFKNEALIEVGQEVDQKLQPRPNIKGNGDESSSAPVKEFQTILVSATLSPSVKKLADFMLNKNAHWVSVNDAPPENLHRSKNVAKFLDSDDDDDWKSDKSGDEATRNIHLRGALKSNQNLVLSLPTGLEQHYVEITLKTRLVTLMSLLLDKARSACLTNWWSVFMSLNAFVVVFLSNCESVEFHHSMLQAARWPNAKLFEARANRKMIIKGPKVPKVTKAEQKWLNSQQQKAKSNSECLPQTNSVLTDESDSDDNDADEEQKSLEVLLGDQICSFLKLYKLHGSLSQADRSGYLSDFNKQQTNAVLLTTDVASRGLNLSLVDWIIQVDPPQEVEEYVHRVGRTARIGTTGKALLFLQEHELVYIDYLRSAGVIINSMPELQIIQPLCQEYLPEELRSRRLKNLSSFLTSFLSKQVSADIDLLHSARRSFTASYRAYRCYSQEFKKIFNVKKLHLGHLASAFCLNESPSLIGEKCKAGVMAAAARSIMAKQKEKQLQKKNKKKDCFVNRYSNSSNKKDFGKVADGVLNTPAPPILKKINLPLAQKILKKGRQLSTNRSNDFSTTNTTRMTNKQNRITRDPLDSSSENQSHSNAVAVALERWKANKNSS